MVSASPCPSEGTLPDGSDARRGKPGKSIKWPLPSSSPASAVPKPLPPRPLPAPCHDLTARSDPRPVPYGAPRSCPFDPCVGYPCVGFRRNLPPALAEHASFTALHPRDRPTHVATGVRASTCMALSGRRIGGGGGSDCVARARYFGALGHSELPCA